MNRTIGFLRAAQGGGEHWGSVVKAAVTALGPLPSDANFGLAYATEELIEDLPSILTFLRETTPIKQWTIALGSGILGPLGVVQGRPALALLAAQLPEASFRRFESWREPQRSEFLNREADWLYRQDMPVALIHGDAQESALVSMIADLAESAAAFLVGAVAPVQAGGLAGVMLGTPLRLLTGLTQGCLPLGGPYRVSESSDNIIIGLEGRPALEVMREVIDPRIAQDLRRAAGVIHIGLPVAGADRADYLVRPLMAIDPTRGWLAVNSEIAVGDRVLFVQRDNDSAQRDMRRMLNDVAVRAGGQTIRGGIYISCVARGAAMFGSDDCEADMIKEQLGDFPLIGIIGQGEICHDRLYGYTGVLALLMS